MFFNRYQIQKACFVKVSALLLWNMFVRGHILIHFPFSIACQIYFNQTFLKLLCELPV